MTVRPDDDDMLGVPLLDGAEAAQLLKVPRSSLMELARRGVVPSLRVGRHRRFVRADLEEWVRGQRQGAARCPRP